MEYQWDDNKAASNLRKHDIDFADAVSVFTDDAAITIVDEHRHGCICSDIDSNLYVAWGEHKG